MQRAASAYFQTKVTTTSQGDILIMLYDGALTFLQQAKERLAANDMAGKGINISKALDVINELDSTLNMEKGGSLAGNLHNLYFFCSKQLVMANLKKSQQMIDEVIKILSGLRSAYAEIISLPEAQAAAQEAAANLNITAGAPTRMGPSHAATGAETPAPGAAARAKALFSQHKTAQATGDGLDEPETAAEPQETSPPAPPSAPQAIKTSPDLRLAATYSQTSGQAAPLPGVKPTPAQPVQAAPQPIQASRPTPPPVQPTVQPAVQATPRPVQPTAQPAVQATPRPAVAPQPQPQTPGFGTMRPFGAGVAPAASAAAAPPATEPQNATPNPQPAGTPLPVAPETQVDATMPPPASGFGRSSLAANALYRKFSG